mgnify:CR=1 FL=1
MEKIVSLCKRRGFVFPSSEIYGGFSSTYDYGPYGVELKNNIKKSWWKFFVEDRDDVVGLDGAILMHPKTWEASGHLADFNDVLVDCRKCRARFRADHLIAESLNLDAEGKTKEEMTKIIKEKKIKCPICGQSDFTEARKFNNMFKTFAGVTEDKESIVYLRPETAQAIFLNYKNILDSTRVKIPFGIAQIGKAFRNEITPGNFIFRTREFEQMEIEYFISPKADWKKIFKNWAESTQEWLGAILNNTNKISLYEHSKEKLSHYSKKTVDIEYDFPFGKKELYGLAYRTDYDLSQHQKFSGADLAYRDSLTGEKYLPHVIEPSFGLDRALLAVLSDAYNEEKVPVPSAAEGGDEVRVVMKFKAELAPIKAAVFPLLKNRPELVKKAKEIYNALKLKFMCEFDDNGNIGKRYRRQDEIGTPFCITIDFDSLKNEDATVRDRDTMKQERVSIKKLEEYLKNKLS